MSAELCFLLLLLRSVTAAGPGAFDTNATPETAGSNIQRAAGRPSGAAATRATARDTAVPVVRTTTTTTSVPVVPAEEVPGATIGGGSVLAAAKKISKRK